MSRARIAFLILNHRDPAQLLRLMATLRRELPDAPVVVHNDRFRTEVSAPVINAVGNSYLLTSDKPIIWADFSQIDACWRSMAWMTEHIDFDWLIVLSAQDYPIKKLAALGDYITSTGADALFRAVPLDDLDKSLRRYQRRRYLYQYGPQIDAWQSASLSGRLLRRLQPGAVPLADILNNMQPFLKIFKAPDQALWRLGWRARTTPFTKEKPCWFSGFSGSWVTLSRRATEFVVKSVRDRPDYVSYYRRTVGPDESATATLICNEPELRVEPCDLHHVRWTHRDTGHPDVFRTEDLPELLAAPEYFARKFDLAEDAEILDRLDDALADSDKRDQLPIPRDTGRNTRGK